jgi:YVTN family beta-propeller protein
LAQDQEKGREMKTVTCALVVGGLVLSLGGCGDDSAAEVPVTQAALKNRAYIVARDSDELTVIDLETLEVIGSLKTGGIENHMAELNADFTKLYIDSSHTDEAVVVDVKTITVTNRITVGKHPTHLSLTPKGLMAIMAEEDGAVSFVDTVSDTEVKRLRGFYTPHFLRVAADGKHGFVANLGAGHISRVDLDTLEIDRQLALDGVPVPSLVPDEGGFADAQINQDGVLFAAHNQSGRVLRYDTTTETLLPEIEVGANPWIVYAEHPFANVTKRYLVPNFGSRTVSMLGATASTVMATMPGDQESFGVNYTSVAPQKAFVMNRIREDVSVVDLDAGVVTARIDVGGNTETASTSADGKLIVAAVSGADKVVVIDALTNQIIKTFDKVGKYPWSVTIPGGQNYCH